MKDNEFVKNMYSRLNLIINEINSIDLTKLGGVDIVRKIISLLLQQIWEHHHHPSQYGGLSIMTLGLVIDKLEAYEMSWKMGQEEATSSRKGIALTCEDHKKNEGQKAR
jgi:hypothetical protein